MSVSSLGENAAGGGSGSDDQTAAEVSYSPSSGGLSATNVQDAIDELVVAASSGRLIGFQKFETPGAYTYTPTAGAASVIIKLLGGGGGGAGVASAAALQVNLGGGGAGGAWLQKRLTANFSGATGVVGAKGPGGAAGNNNGTAGGNTTFVDSSGAPVTYTAAGGPPGVPRTSFVPPITTGGGAGGAATNGDINVSGESAVSGIAPNAFVGWASGGGGSEYGPFTPVTGVVNANSTAGANGSGKGTGGSGACSANAGGAKAGGDGTDGMVIIYEYS